MKIDFPPMVGGQLSLRDNNIREPARSRVVMLVIVATMTKHNGQVVTGLLFHITSGIPSA